MNFNDYRDLVLANTPPRFLIIHGDYSNANFQSAIDNFVLWKRQKGADVDVATTAVGQAGNSTASIQTYIRNRYNNPATRPDYVILIGDNQGSFAVPCYTNNSGATDYPYTFMNTNDILGDVFIGRISAETTEQLLVILNKIYVYERDIDVANATWLNRMLLVGDNDPSGISTQYISKYIREMALEVNGSYSFTELYGPDFYSFVNSINAAINQGIGFYSYRGFIDFVPPNESLIYNGNMLPHAVLITCATGDYNSSISLGETEMIIRYGSTSVPKGSVTAIGMSTSTTHTTFNNVLHGGIFDGIYTHGMRTMGEALLHGKLYMNEMFGVSSPSNVEKFTHWCNLMGDPTMEVYTGIPGTFQITVDTTIPVGLSLLDVAIRNANNNVVAGASVVLSQGSVILSRGYTDSEGNVILIMPSGLTAGAAVITVSAHSYKPLIHPVTIANISTLVPATMIIDDDSAGASNGNGNSIITAGETVELYFGLRNTGSTTISNISGTLSCDSPWVTLMQTNVSYPSIAGGATASNNQALVLRLSRKTPHETMLRLHLNLIDSNLNQYHVSEFIEIEAAKMNFVACQVMDAANQVLDPGETANMNITIINVGDAIVDNVYAELISQNDLLVVTDNTGYFGTLSLNTNLTNDSNNFQVWARDQILPGMVMPMSLRLYTNRGFEQFVPFSLTIGTVTQNDPLGPDTYGYIIYDWTDTSYYEAPVYDWVEIAPSLGGLGTALDISDAYSSGEEGDQVGATSLANVELPFPFQFYGRLYDHITVCSNGFIALGETGNGEFRNFRLPGAMGPSPMIAAFWDDLATHAGSGIFTYFDRANARFIIEWYNMLNGFNGSSPETFQIILHDQSRYYTSMGDGPIKIQYHTFNNVNAQSGNKHGNFCTIGIEDHSGTRGLEYTFNNSYPTAAAPLSHQKAILITNNPSQYDAPTAVGNISNASIRVSEQYQITNVSQYFTSTVPLTYSCVAHANVLFTADEGNLNLIPNAGWYGIAYLTIRATDPMGRYADQPMTLTVLQAMGIYQNFNNAGSLPTGWAVFPTTASIYKWQTIQEDGTDYAMKTYSPAGNAIQTRLTTQNMNLTGYQNTQVRFYMDLVPSDGYTALLRYSYNNINFYDLAVFDVPYKGFYVLSTPVLDNRSSVRLRWEVVSTTLNTGQPNYWIIDDFSVTRLVQDYDPPTNVAGLSILAQEGNSVTLGWEASYDAYFSRYEVYLSTSSTVTTGDQLHSVAQDPALANASTLQTTISNLPDGQYLAAVRAVDTSSNASPLSANVSFTIGIVSITPAVPQNLSISTENSNVLLAWDAVTTDENGSPVTVTGYKVYMSEEPYFDCNDSTLVETVTTNTVTLPGLGEQSEKLFFKVKAYKE